MVPWYKKDREALVNQRYEQGKIDEEEATEAYYSEEEEEDKKTEDDPFAIELE